MATLEKIRSKSVFLLVIIGLALLAFILTDFLTSGRTLFGNGTTIAKVDGHKIDVMDFQRRVEEQTRQMQNQGKVDMAQIQARVLSEMLAEALYNQEIEELGLVVTDQELTDFMLGDGAPSVDNLVQNLSGKQIGSVKELYDMIGNPQKYGLDQQNVAMLQTLATEVENQVEKMLLSSKFGNLLAGTLVANELDALAFYNDNTTTSNIAFARQDYSTLPDDQFEVTDDEIKSEWNNTRNAYRIDEPTRRVSFITVDIVPSAQDVQAAQKKVEDAVESLRNGEGAQGLADNTDFVVNTEKKPGNKITDRRLKSFLDSAAVGSTKLVSQVGNDYTIAKLLGQTSGVDSINIAVLAVEGKAQTDSILAQLKSGTLTLDEAMKNPAVVQSTDSLWVSTFDSNWAPMKEMLLEAQTGTYFTPDTTDVQIGRIFSVRNRRAAVPVYEYVLAEFSAEPSNATVNTLLDDLNKYIAANKTPQAFADNAAQAGYQVQTATLTPSSFRLGMVPESRGAVRWAMQDAKKGQISDVFGSEETGRYIVVAVSDVYDGDFIPYSDPDVREAITKKLRNNKKADQLIAKYNGKAKDVAGYATLMNTQVDTTTVTFGQPMIPKFGSMDSKLAANVAVAQPNKVVGPIQGSNGVVAFVVTSVDKASQPYDFKDAAARYNGTRGGQALLQRNAIPVILLGRNKIQNNSLKFFSE